MVSVCLLLVGLAFIQDPGLLTSDTKFDLVISPGDFLARALHLWDGQGAFGQLQNQAYGYLWPMGPFFWLGSVLDLPGWVIQRLWLALVMCVAFLGMGRLTRALGVRSDLACIVAGLAYALSPRLLTVLGPISIEGWPSAVAPWVLLFLVRGSTSGSPRRAAALSALAVAMVGGVNAAATSAVLPVAAVWLLTRAPGPRRRSMMIWWPVFTLVGTLWWLVPLFALGAYSPPFLDFIETAGVTTFPTTVFDALRGTSDWVPYVSGESRAGNSLITTGYLALNSGVVLVLGFAGMMHRRQPHRLFLALSLLLGVVMVGAGHVGSVSGFFAADVRQLLDGALAPLRNVHKFDPVIRLPLVIGLAWTLETTLQRRAARKHRPGDGLEALLGRVNQAAAIGIMLFVVGAAALPAFAGKIPPASPVFEVPGYWRQAASWLDRNEGRALLAPGTPFADYIWGSPRDEPLQYLTQSEWAVRNQIPLTPPGSIRMLDEIESQFSQGRGSAGLSDYLRRAGVRYLVVRNDLLRRGDTPDPVLVHQALAETPGVARVATFGPEVGGGAHLYDHDVRVLVNSGWQAEYPAIEVFEVSGTPGAAATTATPTVVAGGPEDLLDLASLGVIGTGGTVLAADVPSKKLTGPLADAPVVLTDGLRARERSFARLHDGASAALTPGDVRRTGNPTRDYLAPGQEAWTTTVELDGARTISASSSGSDATSSGGADRGLLPYSALDGDTETEWVTNPADSERDWWQVDFERPLALQRVQLTGGSSASEDQTVRVVTDSGKTDEIRLGPGVSQEVTLDAKSTRSVRVEAPVTAGGRELALAEVEVPGLRVTRRLELPGLPRDWGAPDAIVLRADLDARTGCALVSGSIRCSPSKARTGEEATGSARRVLMTAAGSYTPDLRVRPRAGAGLDALLLKDQPVNISASTVAVDDARASAVAAIDGDPSTTWLAAADDLRPTLNLGWLTPQRLTRISVSGSDDTAARRPTEVTLRWPGGERAVKLDNRGGAAFPEITAKQLRIEVTGAETVRDLDFSGQGSTVSVGIGELRLTGTPFVPLALPVTPVDRGCGSGPTVEINGSRHPTSVDASASQLYAGESLPARICVSVDPRASGAPPAAAYDEIALDAGTNEVTVISSSAFAFESLVMRAVDVPAATGVSGNAALQRQGPTRFTAHTGTDDALLSVRQNFNAGWRAEQHTRRLDAIVVDGWQQGWIVPQASQVVRAEFTPDTAYRVGLVLGLLALLGLFLGVVVTSRRRPHHTLPAVGSRDASALVVGAAAVVGVGLIAGWGGLVVAAVVGLSARALQDRQPEAAPWMWAMPCVVASLAYLVQPWGTASGWAGSHAWPHYLVLVSLVAAVTSLFPGRPKFFTRIDGSSTTR